MGVRQKEGRGRGETDEGAGLDIPGRVSLTGWWCHMGQTDWGGSEERDRQRGAGSDRQGVEVIWVRQTGVGQRRETDGGAGSDRLVGEVR